MCRHLEGAKQGLRERMQVGSHGKCVVLVQDVWRASQVVALAGSLWSILGNFLKVITAVAKVKQIPVIVVAPVLHVFAAKVCKWMVRALWWKKLTSGACGQRDLNAAEADVPVNVVFKNECCLVSRI